MKIISKLDSWSKGVTAGVGIEWRHEKCFLKSRHAKLLDSLQSSRKKTIQVQVLAYAFRIDEDFYSFRSSVQRLYRCTRLSTYVSCQYT